MNIKTIRAQGHQTKYGKRIGVTLPDYLWDWMKKEAIENQRSIAAQVIYMLEQHIPKDEARTLRLEGVNWPEPAE